MVMLSGVGAGAGLITDDACAWTRPRVCMLPELSLCRNRANESQPPDENGDSSSGSGSARCRWCSLFHLAYSMPVLPISNHFWKHGHVHYVTCFTYIPRQYEYRSSLLLRSSILLPRLSSFDRPNFEELFCTFLPGVL